VTRALIVEDSKLASKAIEQIINSYHLDYDIAFTGKDALMDIDKYDYDLAFVDIGLPDMNGLKLIAKIRIHYLDKKRIPIVALTMHSNDDYKQAAIDYGASEFITKPLTLENFQRILEKYLSNR